jgi:hypothetical protein
MCPNWGDGLDFWGFYHRAAQYSSKYGSQTTGNFSSDIRDVLRQIWIREDARIHIKSHSEKDIFLPSEWLYLSYT